MYATDSSESAAIAGRLLATLPLSADARVTVLSVIPQSSWVETPPPGAEASPSPMLAELVEQEAGEPRLGGAADSGGGRAPGAARRAAETAAALLRECGITTAVSVRRGSPGDAILEQARENAAELIVVGSHGMGTMERLLVGSVSERVARYALCSVLVARGDTLRHAIIAMDDSESADEALGEFVRLPLPAEMAVTVVHVIGTSDLPFPVPVAPGVTYEALVDQSERELRAAAERLLSHAQERLRAVGRETAKEASPSLRARVSHWLTAPWVTPSASVIGPTFPPWRNNSGGISEPSLGRSPGTAPRE